MTFQFPVAVAGSGSSRLAVDVSVGPGWSSATCDPQPPPPPDLRSLAPPTSGRLRRRGPLALWFAVPAGDCSSCCGCVV